MPIVARDLDVSEKKVVFHQYLQGSASGSFILRGAVAGTYLIAMVPFPFEVCSVASACSGSSSTPALTLQNYRFLPGTGGGATMFGPMNASFALCAVGTSGINSAMAGTVTGWSLIAAPGATILQGVAGDILTLAISAGQVNDLTVTVVVKKLQDIASHFGIST